MRPKFKPQRDKLKRQRIALMRQRRFTNSHASKAARNRQRKPWKWDGRTLTVGA